LKHKKINESKELGEYLNNVFQKFSWSFIQFTKFLFIFIFYAFLITIIYVITIGYFIYKSILFLMDKFKENNKMKRGYRR